MANPGIKQVPDGKLSPAITVVVPAFDEADNILPLAGEIAAALDAEIDYEILYVDDGSDDATPARLAEAAQGNPRLRWIRHRDGCGQSAAVISGVKAAQAPIIVTIDGDGQNDPTDIPRLLKAYQENSVEDARPLLIAGLRARRRDNWRKRISSRVANGVRGWILDDRTPDTGCGLKVFSRAVFMDMPHFDHMHRFLPALTIRQGGHVLSVPVNHRPRERGESKYGTFDRLWVGVIDLFGVMWLIRRARQPEIETHEDSNSEGHQA